MSIKVNNSMSQGSCSDDTPDTLYKVSSFCNSQHCVSVAKVSSFCNNAACVSVEHTAQGQIIVKDTKNQQLMPLAFTADEWNAFVKGVKNGEFDFLPE